MSGMGGKSSWRLWLGSYGTALGLHVLAGLLITYGLAPAPRPVPGEPPAAMMVELAPEPSAPLATPSEPKPEPPRPVEEKLDIPPVEELPVKVAEVVIPRKKEEPQRETPPPAPPTVTAPPAQVAAAPREGAANSAPSNAEQSWEGLVLAKLEKNKRYPRDAQRAGIEDTVFVRLTIDRSGRVLGATVSRSRGNGQLDAEVLSLARRASPLPPPPEAVAGERITLVVPVEFLIRRAR